MERDLTSGGELRLVADAEHAGAGSVTLEVPAAQTVPTGQLRLAMLEDPDGSTVVLAQTLSG